MRKKPSRSRLRRFFKDVSIHTPFSQMVILLIVLWIGFAFAIYVAEQGRPDSWIDSFGRALYWGVAAFSTAGIAALPVTPMAQVLGAIWIVIGSVLFFGTIVATITTYFMRPMQSPHKKIIDTIEYNLEQLDDLTLDELDLLKETVDTLIVHVEQLKRRRT